MAGSFELLKNIIGGGRKAMGEEGMMQDAGCMMSGFVIDYAPSLPTSLKLRRIILRRILRRLIAYGRRDVSRTNGLKMRC
jgi:hypothetical protein